LLALRLVRAHTYSVLLSLEPAVAAITGFLIIGQRLSWVEVAAIGAVFWADADRDKAEEIYEEARAAYLDATQVDEIETRYEAMLEAYDEYEEKHLLRRRFTYIAGIIYLANIADAIFLFPETGDGYYAAASLPERPGIYANVEPDAVRLGVSVPF